MLVSSNRTFMELKLASFNKVTLPIGGSNRTFMELKQDTSTDGSEGQVF